MHVRAVTSPHSTTPCFVNEVENLTMAHPGAAEDVDRVVVAPLQDPLDPLLAEGVVVVANPGVVVVVELRLHVQPDHRAFPSLNGHFLSQITKPPLAGS